MGQLVVRTNGQTLLLTAATNPAGSTVGVWSDSGLSSAVTLPATVSADTTYWLRDGDTTITVTQPDGSVVFSGAVSIGAWPREVTPVPTNPQVWADVAGLSGTYARLRSQRDMPRLKALPVLTANPPTISFVGTSQASSTGIASGVFLSAVDVPFPGTPTALSSNFTYTGGAVVRNNTYYALPTQPTQSSTLPYRVRGWFYGLTIEFSYRGQGQLTSRLYVDGDYAETLYTTDSTQNGAPHSRSFTWPTAAWRFLEFECAAAFYGIWTGPTDTWIPAPTPDERLLIIGDSYGGGTGATANFTGYAHTMGRLLGFEDVWSYSLGGTGVLAVNGGNPKYRDRATDWAASSATAVMIQHSINDDASSTSAINAEMELLVAAARANVPTAKTIWIQGPPAKGGGDVASKQARDAVFSAHAASIGIPYVSLVTPALWSGTGRVGATTGSGNSDVMLGSDAAHPTQAGHDMIAVAAAQRFIDLLPAA